ncbi:Tim44 domain-containing protein [Desulfosoma caldarium]|uniref:Putative lipid-binding transport protein (Tim44 family) n=1 Tax=Desulfosoma caldarium TaxID=610254 RepID=A0A3N1UI25_9BACT|nr:Tim44-like domain-containing protein [Desulfosoma caldarium]ROQ90914.1 putative lipid-binding transport protein (Tim44 family) [Desulfosoma caldarium]
MDKKRLLVLCGLCVLGFFLWTLWADVADAARFGGGKSFGSRPSYQRSAPAPSKTYSFPRSAPGQMSGGAMPRSPLSSPTRSWGGMLGGLLLGGLVGSLLFGGAHAWGGPSLLDLLVIGGGLFLLFRFLKARRLATSSASGFNTAGSGPWAESSQGFDRAGSFRTGVETASGAAHTSVPEDFDAHDFLEKAKALYVQLQEAWDRRDLKAIQPFVSPEVFEEIQRQAQEDPQPSRTYLLWIQPELLEVRDMDGDRVASVLFDVMMRETDQEMAKQVRELWHFRRQGASPSWIVEGLQQVAG